MGSELSLQERYISQWQENLCLKRQGEVPYGLKQLRIRSRGGPF